MIRTVKKIKQPTVKIQKDPQIWSAGRCWNLFQVSFLGYHHDDKLWIWGYCCTAVRDVGAVALRQYCRRQCAAGGEGGANHGREARYTAAVNGCSYSLCRQRDTGSANLLPQGTYPFLLIIMLFFFNLVAVSGVSISYFADFGQPYWLCCYCRCCAAVGVRCSEPRGRRREREATRARKSRGTCMHALGSSTHVKRHAQHMHRTYIFNTDSIYLPV